MSESVTFGYTCVYTHSTVPNGGEQEYIIHYPQVCDHTVYIVNDSWPPSVT
ncbi:MAG: hypothetical protein Q4D41_07455 [Prevotellaceae bacterium]|nr:hypothetical protein [Prevotellaceae bacterium]